MDALELKMFPRIMFWYPIPSCSKPTPGPPFPCCALSLLLLLKFLVSKTWADLSLASRLGLGICAGLIRELGLEDRAAGSAVGWRGFGGAAGAWAPLA